VGQSFDKGRGARSMAATPRAWTNCRRHGESTMWEERGVFRFLTQHFNASDHGSRLRSLTSLTAICGTRSCRIASVGSRGPLSDAGSSKSTSRPQSGGGDLRLAGFARRLSGSDKRYKREGAFPPGCGEAPSGVRPPPISASSHIGVAAAANLLKGWQAEVWTWQTYRPSGACCAKGRTLTQLCCLRNKYFESVP